MGKSILSPAARKKLAGFLESYVEGVAELQKDMKARIESDDKGNIFDGLDLAWQGAFGGKKDRNNLPVSKDTQKHLINATQLLLDKSKLGKRVSFQHVFDVLKQELGDEFLDEELKKPSVHKTIDRSLTRLTEKVESLASHVFPVVYTMEPKQFSFSIGPLDFLDFATFENTEVVQRALKDEVTENIWDKQFLEAYELTKSRAKHIAVVSVSGFETDKGREVARSAVEFFLNLLRLSFQWDPDKNPKVLDRNYTDHNAPQMVIHDGTRLSKSYGGSPSEYSFLKDGVEREVLRGFKSHVPMLCSIIDGMSRAASYDSPILQRIEYASFLITSAFEQRSVRIALVNFVSSLEALACLNDETSKRAELVERCRKVILDLDDEEQDSVAEAVENAYRARNAVVHGDAISEDDYWVTLRALEKWMLALHLSFLGLLCHMQDKRAPKSSKRLRQAMHEHFNSG